MKNGGTIAVYRDDEEGGNLMFDCRCPICGRFVKHDDTIYVNGIGQPSPEPNAMCKRHGRVTMLFIGYDL